ncbi:hypothetical protein PIB30_092153 [Stylosanthes scabra]|uniref:Uncharacterized protein n=1 Tax=Stylosanthes scabra TaxID=79078 RepID=A0ABU6QV45_9FABA|nr:hypothetical protein [Stylosanthes scabra]
MIPRLQLLPQQTPARCLFGTGMTAGMMFEQEQKRSRTSSWSTTSGMPHSSARHLMRLLSSGGRSGGRFRFARGDEANIRKAWEIRAAKRHRGMMHNIREKGAPHHWIPDDIFRRYVDYWASVDFQAKRRANKSNRASIIGGSLHTGGRPLTLPLQRRWFATELGSVPSQSEVFLRTHTRKKDRGQFVNERSEQQIEQYKAEIKRLEDERAARIAADELAGPPIDEDEV